MKYVQNLSSLFETMELLSPPFELPQNVKFYKAVHELDGNTYIVKKTKFFIQNDEKLKHHPAPRQIAEVKQPKNWADIRYVNSWVELDQNQENSGEEAQKTSEGLHLLLCIQMRYTNDLTKLAKDLVIFSGREDLDEDTVYDIAEDTLEKVDQHQNMTRKEAIINSFAEIGHDPAATPNGLELQTWKICFEDALEA